jgi:hypothetical protein
MLQAQVYHLRHAMSNAPVETFVAREWPSGSAAARRQEESD